MKAFILILMPSFAFSNLFSQNLVPNPSFEQYISCPDNQCQIHRSAGWKSWNASPDYFNNLCPLSSTTFQAPSTGNAYAGFFAYEGLTPESRELIGVQLSTALTIGQTYYVSGKFSLAEYAQYACNKLGFLFATTPHIVDSVTACNNIVVNPSKNSANTFSSQVISDTLNWITISGSFIADSAYQYVIIGNHFSDANTTAILFNSSNCCAAYYFLDDVYVGTDSTQGVHDHDLKNRIAVYPNPFSKFSTVTISDATPSFKEAKITIYTLIGDEIYNVPITAGISIIERSNLPAGIYLLQVKIVEKIYYKKIIITD